jgi:CHAT domain-containing protein
MLRLRLVAGWLFLALFVTPSLAQVPPTCDAIGEFQPRRTLYLNAEHRQAVELAAAGASPERNQRIQAAAVALDRMLTQAIAREGASSFTAGMVRYDLSQLLSASAKLDGRAPLTEEGAALDAMLGAARSREQVEVLAAAMGKNLRSSVWDGRLAKLYPGAFRMIANGFGGDHRQIPLLTAIASRISIDNPLRQAVVREQYQAAQRLTSSRFRFDASVDLIELLTPAGGSGDLRSLVEGTLPEFNARVDADIGRAQRHSPRPNEGGLDDCRFVGKPDSVFRAARVLGMAAEIKTLLPRLIARRGLDVETGTDFAGFYGYAQALMDGRLIDQQAYRRGLDVFGRGAGLCKTEGANWAACGALLLATAASSLGLAGDAQAHFKDALALVGAGEADKESRVAALAGYGQLQFSSGLMSEAASYLARAAAENSSVAGSMLNSIDRENHPLNILKKRAIVEAAIGNFDAVEIIISGIVEGSKNYKNSIINSKDKMIVGNVESEISFIDEILTDLAIANARRRFCGDCRISVAETLEGHLLQILERPIAERKIDPRHHAATLLALPLLKTRTVSDHDRERYSNEFLRNYNLQRAATGSMTNLKASDFEIFLRNRTNNKSTNYEIAKIIALYEIGPSQMRAPEPDRFYEALVERDIKRKRPLVTSTMTEPIDALQELGASVDSFTAIDNFARHLLAAGYSVASRLVFEDLIRLTRPENEPRANDPAFVSDYQRGLASILLPAHARLAQFASERKDWAEVRFHLARVRAIAMARLTREWSAASEQASTLFREFKPALRLAAQIGTRLAAEPATGKDAPAFADAAFADLQRAMMSDAALSFLASQKRRVTAEPALADAIRRRGEAEQGLLEVKLFGEGARKLDAGVVDALEARHKAALAEASAVITRLLPVPEELTSIESVSLAAVRRQLLPNEGLLVLHAGSDNVYGMLVRRDGAAKAWVSRLTAKELEARIGIVRAGLDVSGGLLPRFPFEEAHGLFEALLGPARTEISGLSRLIVVSDGPLQALPLGILPVRKPAVEPATPADYRTAGVEWLALGPSIVYLPSVRSLDQRGRQQLASRAAHAFLGVGDPVLAGSPGVVRSVDVSAALTKRSLADPAALRRLPALPDTSQEIKALSAALGARPSDILLGGQATETALRRLQLTDYRIVGFATHGLVAGDLDGLAEPGLVLTPPEASSAEDDGILTMSEISQMKFDADLVILSACNTASSDGRAGAQGLSGLARSFLGAGARGLIVTHWAIPSAPAVELTTRAAAAMKANSGIGWDRAVRSAASDLIASAGPPEYAHPANWGAFVAFGLQGAARAQ